MTFFTTHSRSSNRAGLLRRALLLAVAGLAVACAGTTLRAQVQHVNVGKGPAFLFADTARNRVHLISAGVDANFNGVLDQGDAAPTWSVT
ncbi:MAG: hypothetical protein UZ07_CHB004001759 [Chlorobi bacterium OLB7]|nr:MAG: hypothetical protein UZ07_CHB004001759 [Chlorobi bacterium OLB7]